MNKSVVCVTAVFVLFPTVCWCQDAALEERVKTLEARLARLEQRLGEQEQCVRDQKICIQDQEKKIQGYESRLLELDRGLHREFAGELIRTDGVRIGAGITAVVQGTANANAGGQTREARTDASYSTDVTLEKVFADSGGKAFIHLEAGEGAGITDDLALFSNVNTDAIDDANVTVSEAWYEQAFLAEKALFTFGKLNPTIYFDTNDAANDETTQFISDMFGNSPVIEFPGSGPGIRAGFAPCGWFAVDYGIFDGDADFEKIGDNLFNIAQLNFKPGFLGRDGNYRFIGWYSNVNHTKWLDSDKTKKAAYGLGVSFDQKLTADLTVFTRYGWQNPRVYDPLLTASGDRIYSLERSWSAGYQLAGTAWGRKNDVWAAAVGWITPSRYYKEADPSRRARTEGHFETYYRIQVNDHLAFSPDFQYIWNPFGKDIPEDTSAVQVYGLRSQIDF